MHAVRRRVRWIGVALAVAVVAVDVGVVLARGSGPSYDAYLRLVRAQSKVMFYAVAPTQQLVTSLEFETSPDQPSLELYSARDAFADPAPGAAVRAVAGRLSAARAPASVRGDGHELSHDASRMGEALADLAAESAVTDPKTLGDTFVRRAGKQLEAAERDWTATLGRLFAGRRLPPTLDPDTIPDLAPTLVTWTFNSDLACWNDVLDVQAQEGPSGPTPRTLTKVAQDYRDAAYRLRQVQPPANASTDVRTGVAARLGGLDELAGILQAWARSGHFPKSLGDRARQAVTRLDALSRTYSAHHVHACASLTSLRAQSPFGPLPGPTVTT